MPALFIIYLFIIRIAVEEVFFRGFLMKYSQDWLSGLLPKSRIFAPHYGVLFSSAIFGLMHFAYGSFIEILGAFILGIILCLAAQRNGTIIPNIFAHMLYNALVVCLAVSAVF
jgi:membrane protease YdiL (CAAX protease family)